MRYKISESLSKIPAHSANIISQLTAGLNWKLLSTQKFCIRYKIKLKIKYPPHPPANLDDKRVYKEQVCFFF